MNLFASDVVAKVFGDLSPAVLVAVLLNHLGSQIVTRIRNPGRCGQS